jgi:transposase
MTQGTLIPNISEVALVCIRPRDGAIQMVLRACRPSSACPFCGTVSRRVHSRYLRKVGDLPWEKVPVLIHLQTRKFFCDGKGCRRSIFTEPLPGTVQRYARRLAGRLRLWIGSPLLWEGRQEHAWQGGLAC